MTESQIKQFSIRQKELEKKCEMVKSLNTNLVCINRDYGSNNNGTRFSSLDSLFRSLWRINEIGVNNTLVLMAERIIKETQAEIDNTSLLDILSQIERGQNNDN